MASVLIKNGTLVTAAEIFEADLYVEGEQIHSIGKNLSVKADRVLDANGCYVIPGGVDAHTHMELPFMGTQASDDFYSGTLAGLYGGTTSIIDFAIQTPGDTLSSALNTWHKKAKGKAVGDYAFHMGVTDFNEKTKVEIKELIESNVTSFKIFMAYKGALMLDDDQIIGLMKEVKKYGGLSTVHAENGNLVDALIQENRAQKNLTPEFHALSRPPIVEAEATGRIIDIAYQGGHPLYIVHMTCEEALNRVKLAAQRNQKVYVETCVQYLLLDDSAYLEKDFGGAKYVMSPPLRKKSDQTALWNGIEQNLVDVVATDHCPFCMNQKRMGKDDFSKIPNGAPGIEHRMELMFSEGVMKNRISLNKFVELNSTSPAKIFGMYPKKGGLSVGGDADIVIFDPNKRHTISAKTHHMNCDYSAYEGWQVQGQCRTVLLRGQVVIDQGKSFVNKGFGQYIPRGKPGVHYV